MPTALLILLGGRLMPNTNMLTIINQKPKLVVGIVAENGRVELPRFESAITELFRDMKYAPQLDTRYYIDVFDRSDVYEKCLLAVKNHPGFEWIFDISAAPTIMSIGAYVAAKDLFDQGTNLRCWYVNASHHVVVPLIGKGIDSDLFNISVAQYAAAYNCRLASGILEEQRQYCQEHWIPFTQLLVANPTYIDLLKDVLKKTGKPSKENSPKRYSLTSQTKETHTLLEEAYKVGLLDDFQRNGSDISIKLSYREANFLDGTWLELYIWNEARQTNLFSDCQWNQRLVDLNQPETKDSINELDVAMIYNGQLLVIECKTKPLESESIYKLDSVTRPLGGVLGKMLVTTTPIPDHDPNQRKAYQDIKHRAAERGIRVMNREELSNIREVITQQVRHPEFPRI